MEKLCYAVETFVNCGALSEEIITEQHRGGTSMMLCKLCPFFCGLITNETSPLRVLCNKHRIRLVDIYVPCVQKPYHVFSGGNYPVEVTRYSRVSCRNQCGKCTSFGGVDLSTGFVNCAQNTKPALTSPIPDVSERADKVLQQLESNFHDYTISPCPKLNRFITVIDDCLKCEFFDGVYFLDAVDSRPPKIVCTHPKAKNSDFFNAKMQLHTKNLQEVPLGEYYL